jgi:ribosomal protein S12 methylthiotransferase accessory factor
VDITPNIAAVRHTAFKVVMVIIPELQPMHLDERHPYLGGERLYQMPVTLGYKDRPSREEELNPFPHPFL